MATTVEDLDRLEKKIAARKEDRARAQGAVEQLKSRLRSEFGVDNLAAGEELLTDINAKVETLSTKYNNEVTALDADLISLGF